MVMEQLTQALNSLFQWLDEVTTKLKDLFQQVLDQYQDARRANKEKAYLKEVTKKAQHQKIKVYAAPILRVKYHRKILPQ